jgi:hypothetical protein
MKKKKARNILRSIFKKKRFFLSTVNSRLYEIIIFHNEQSIWSKTMLLIILFSERVYSHFFFLDKQ